MLNCKGYSQLGVQQSDSNYLKIKSNSPLFIFNKIDTNYLNFTGLNPKVSPTGLLFTTAESKYIYSFLIKHNQIKKNNVYLWSLYRESNSSNQKKTLIIEQDSILIFRLEQNYMLVTEKNNFLQKQIRKKNFIITASLIGVGTLTTILTIQTIRK